MKKRGRPTKKDAKRRAYKVRLSDEEAKKMAFIAYKTDQNVSEILRKGIDLQYEIAKYTD